MVKTNECLIGKDKQDSFKTLSVPFLHKAGLQYVDKKSVSSIINSITSGSKFQQRLDVRAKRISNQAIELKSIIESTDKNSCSIMTLVDSTIKKASIRTLNIIESGAFYLHLDMDAFYASVEELYNPGLANIPMAVGSLSMLTTANYVARRFGISSAMPGYIAKRLCPDLVIVPCRFRSYGSFSSRIKSILLV